MSSFQSLGLRWTTIKIFFIQWCPTFCVSIYYISFHLCRGLLFFVLIFLLDSIHSCFFFSYYSLILVKKDKWNLVSFSVSSLILYYCDNTIRNFLMKQTIQKSFTNKKYKILRIKTWNVKSRRIGDATVFVIYDDLYDTIILLK